MKVIVAGAGFSKPAGVPLLSELLEHVVDIMGKPRRSVLQDEESSDVLRFCRELLGGTDDELGERIRCLGLEALCTAIDWAVDRRDVFEGPLEPMRVARSLMRLLVMAIEKCEASSDVSEYADFLSRLDQDTDGDWALISLNWDTVVERAARDRKIAVSLGPTIFRRTTDESFGRFSCPGKRLLMKLHGSITWGECPQCRGLFEVTSPNLGSCPNCQVYSLSLRPIVVVPTLIKRIHNPSLELLWDEALPLIRRSSQLVIVGYSLPVADYEVRHLLARAAKGKDEVRVVLCAHDREAGTEERYRSLLGWSREVFCYSGTESLLSSGP